MQSGEEWKPDGYLKHNNGTPAALHDPVFGGVRHGRTKMKQTFRNAFAVALSACVLLSLTALNADCQTIIRRSVGSAASPLYRPLLPYPYYPYSPNTAYGNYPPFPPSTSAQSYSLNLNGANGLLSPLAVPPPPAPQAPSTSQTQSASQTSNPISALRLSSTDLLVQWAGDASSVTQVAFGAFDANGRMLDQETVTQSPFEAQLTLSLAARYYGVQVKYLNGSINTIYNPIR